MRSNRLSAAANQDGIYTYRTVFKSGKDDKGMMLIEHWRRGTGYFLKWEFVYQADHALQTAEDAYSYDTD